MLEDREPVREARREARETRRDVAGGHEPFAPALILRSLVKKGEWVSFQGGVGTFGNEGCRRPETDRIAAGHNCRRQAGRCVVDEAATQRIIRNLIRYQTRKTKQQMK